MEKFIKPEMEVIEFDAEDIITKSCTAYAEAEAPGMPSGDADDCGFGPCGPNDVDFRNLR